MGFDLDEVIRIARRWWWLLLLGPLLGGGIMYFVSKAQQPMYRATATLWLQMAPGSDGPDPSVIQGDIDVAEMYRHLVTVEPILSPVIDELNLPDSVDELRERLSVSVVRSTPLLEITASDAQPDQAAEIADAVARHFGDSIDQLGMNNVSASVPNPNGAGENLVVRTIPAEVPLEPYAPRTTLFALLGAAVGLLIAVGLVGIAALLGKRVWTGVNAATLPQESSRVGIQHMPNLQQSGRD
jgi:succinoglycan biosynthesis transport protein ExoP